MENATTCPPCKKTAKHSKPNKRAIGSIFKPQQQIRRSIKTKKSVQSIADDKILMKLLRCWLKGWVLNQLFYISNKWF